MTSEADPTASGDPLSPRELAAWRGMLRVHARVTQVLDAEMRDAHGLTVSQYEVLLFLGDAPDHRVRMADLAARVLLTRSGVTRLVDRLVDLGFVERCAAEGDGRGAYAQLTKGGAEVLRAARRTHLRGVREQFLGRLDDDEQEALGDAWLRVLGERG
ncbi:MAG: MarR family transcriptional regulator [Patulibacter minatonensis]